MNVRKRPLILNTDQIEHLLAGKLTEIEIPWKNTWGHLDPIICDQDVAHQLYEIEYQKSLGALIPAGTRKWVQFTYLRGDIFYIKEKFAPKSFSEEPPGVMAHYYQADPFASDTWQPANYMKKSCSRIWLEITDSELADAGDGTTPVFKWVIKFKILTTDGPLNVKL